MKIAAGFVVFRRVFGEIEYLLLQASYGEHHWTPPKGHVDPGEDIFSTALRETEEEAGYYIEDLNIFKDISTTLEYNVNGKPKRVVYWLAELLDATKEPKLSEEHTSYKWAAKDEAKALAKYKDLSGLIDLFHSKIK